MLDDDDAVPAVHDALENLEQALHVVAVESGGRFVQEQQSCTWANRRKIGVWSQKFDIRNAISNCRTASGVVAEVADEFQALGFAAGEGVERLTKREVAEADGIERDETLVDFGFVGEEVQGVAHGGREQVGDGFALPADGQHLGLEAAALADGAGHEHIGEELHLHTLAAEALAVIAAALAAVEGKAGGVEAGRLGGGRGRVEFADEFPGLGVERGIRARRAAQRRLINQHDFGKKDIGGDAADGGGVFSQLVALGQQALVDYVVEEGGFAGAGDTTQTDQSFQG